VFVDESGFYVLPMAVRTYAPVGQTPVVSVPLTRDHLSAIGGLTMDGRLVMHIQNTPYKGPDVVRFLHLLLRKIAGPLLVIWDGASIHRSLAVKDFLAQGGATRIHLERLPGYAPELIRRKACGICSSGANSRTFARLPSINSAQNWCGPRNGSDIAKRSCASVSPMLASLFRHLQ
jgi:DDE superfamily endonuclease